MIQVEMSKDIHDFSPKVIAMLDKRQLLFLGASCTYGVPIMLMATSLPIEIRIGLAALLMLPVAACGWVKMYGMPLEKFILHLIVNRYMTPEKRPYVTEIQFEYPDPDPIAPKNVADVKPLPLTWKEKKKRKKHMMKYGAVR